MDFRIFTEPQYGASYEDQLQLALTAERLGFGGYFRSDHYSTMSKHRDALPGPTDSWVTLAGLARETSTIRLGTLVSSATFRLPGILAIEVAQVDAMSGGRVELGLGTGWFEAEHRQYGIPFPGKRFGPFEEQLEIVTGLWGTPVGERFSYAGEHYTLEDSPALPKPTQQHVPLIVGGAGAKKTPALAARFADEFNSWRAEPEVTRERIARVREACEALGRDPESMVFSIAGTTAVGPTEAEFARRADVTGQSTSDLRASGFGGSASEVLDVLGGLQELGVSRVYLQVHDFADHEQLEYIASEILPALQ
ncbi:F420-dependent oxidoreductase-like protein [Microbacteriaceae bacterium SG_E_30_P1]|uniref:F420-dependent oxidoreductase-like protein n=1 Tax=Antiquaquibacter oligotrophicus TaxID=2880260 RepID=A0ABT6KMS4_9MICO|nr:LLM class F420-dependent oxidoreductase [Antiquaquibacter oligotrophicus]MDH6181305.1 F420-dependent oxidoreductase-like protein [Antiquaquibacter oligotrophicus]UDF13002.1 LLM class F420-dependent oxidoreductase [Antiquaquibacter oligotrophicus]